METPSSSTIWYVICNPTSGGGIKPKKIHLILNLLDKYAIAYEFIQTQYAHHEKKLVQKAIEKGYFNFICIGGDGTIHHVINGIMTQQIVKTDLIKIAVIPAGTGNDWVKNYHIPKAPEKAIQLLCKGKSILQDIGKITLRDNNAEFYFNNGAGLGFDAFVVKNIIRYKKWGALAYLIAALKSFRTFVSEKIFYSLDAIEADSTIFLISMGLCRYSGGGMQLTNFKDHRPGYFDITVIKGIRLSRIIFQILKLYNGNINTVKETHCSHARKVVIKRNSSIFIQADGELIGQGSARFKVIPEAIRFIIS